MATTPCTAEQLATDLDTVLSHNVRRLRTRRAWRQQDLAVAAGWSRATVAAVEDGQRRVTVRDAAVLCRVLQVTLAALVEGAEESSALGLSAPGDQEGADRR